MPRAAGPSVQTFFALEQERFSYANAELIRSDQPGELMQFVRRGGWAKIPNGSTSIPLLIIPSCRTSINEASTSSPSDAVGGSVGRHTIELMTAVLDTPQRCHQRIWYVDESIKIGEYEGPIRQLAVVTGSVAKN